MQEKFWKRYQKAEQNNDYQSCIQCSTMLLSEADTFIEFCFERKCSQMRNGMDVLNEWRYHKEQYSKILNTIMYDFQHFSRHDASHSVSILESIELIVGEQRIVSLSRGDLWLLLEAAYSHDLGMALTGEEICEMWKDKGFKEYLLDCLNKRGMEQQKAAGYYKQMDNLLQQRAQMEGLEDSGMDAIVFEDCWPVNISNYVEWLVCDYIRKQHGERNRRIRKRVLTLADSEIPSRMYEMVVTIACLHTEDYHNILKKLPYEIKGLGAEKVYPRFAAAMLRMGDVLDTENNRFSVYSLEHMPEIPQISLAHFGKHRAINVIQISTEKVEVSAVSEDYEVCKETSCWFDSIDREVQQLITHWNEMVPIELSGCTLRPSECKVYFRDKEHHETEYKTDLERHFEVNKQELINLLVGANVYDMEMDFIREYLQNALDASKMQLWQDIQLGEYDELLTYLNDKKMITPFQMTEDVYQRYKVKLKVEMRPDDFKNVYITIEDTGIGIERECLEVISNLGSGWKKRERYGKYIPQMPPWLRPTGGFGIGIQSAFMLTDEVKIETKTRNEGMGRCIILESPDCGGLITSNDRYLLHNGTTVEVRIPIEKFLCWNSKTRGNSKVDFEEVKYLDSGDCIFSSENIESHVAGVLKTYVQAVIPNSIIPISIEVKGFKATPVNRLGWSRIKENVSTHFDLNWKGNRYGIFVYDGGEVTIWDYNNHVYFNSKWKPNNVRNDKNQSIVCYKNVRMTHEKASKNEAYSDFELYVDYMGLQAKEVLKIHRNEFREEFDNEKYIDRYMKLYLHIYCLAEQGELGACEVFDQLRSDKKFQMFRLIMSDEEDWYMIGKSLENNRKMLTLKRAKLKVGYQPVPNMNKLPESDEIDTLNEDKYDRKNIIFNYVEEDVPMCTLFEEYKNIVLGLTEHSFILIERPGTVSVNNITSETIDTFRDWVQEHMTYEEEQFEMKDDADNNDDIEKQLIIEGYYKGLEKFLPVISKKPQISQKYFNVFSNTEGDLKKGIVCLGLAERKSKVTKEGVRKFYEKSYDDDIGQTIFCKNEYTEQYKELYVHKIPYGLMKGRKPPFLISPITSQIRQRMKSNEYLYQTKGYKLSVEDFVRQVIETESFYFLVAWVAENAENDCCKNNKRRVKELYIDYLEKMYTALKLEKGYCNDI